MSDFLGWPQRRNALYRIYAEPFRQPRNRPPHWPLVQIAGAWTSLCAAGSFSSLEKAGRIDDALSAGHVGSW